MNENKIIKSISFTKSDNFEMQLYSHAMKHSAFATYVKRLIQRDLEDGKKFDFQIEESQTIDKLNKRIKELELTLAKVENVIKEVK
ncbi:hypothetical protein P9Y62_15970 [Bacillus thuringiensis]|uniref:Uncharacterized protein n=1 Tax=Bacillus thuringiensis HD-771 TaxID=1218175 RepID=A0A9W3J3V6_BACTU|nr:hypothetical protein [Bacillus thuringiensis]EEM38121.1 hypothetical protein bthur0004_60170 [Bacillus thuringiensis serovar sotto str. T04001]MCU5453993.1 hypothetical protein [Bacillus cereus]AFQ13851.1 hypothetical protein BTG_01730 [Bacillus thuringiensis HD-771]MCU5674985.1 hypothetical protein [Bacillus cereus]MDA2097428.1 hypothetical protein [Bacillus cereus]